MPAAGRERELSNDQMAAIMVAVVVVGVGWAKRRVIATTAGQWLQRHHITLPPEQGLFTIPFLGSVDLPRVLAAVAVTGLVALGAALWMRPWLHQTPAVRASGAKQQPAPANELD